jgi:hypothetical protein
MHATFFIMAMRSDDQYPFDDISDYKDIETINI